MKLRDIIDSPCGLRYMIDSLPLASGYALRYLMDTEALTVPEDIGTAYLRLQEHMSAAADGNLVSMLHSILCNLKDISRTLSRIEVGDTVDDIELFEVKALILLGRRTAAVLGGTSHDSISPRTDALDGALQVLDPDGTEIASFYIYDSYSPELAALRADIRKEADPDRRAALMDREQVFEAGIREDICASLRPYVQELRILQNVLVRLDIDVAKAVMVLKTGLCIPEISTSGITSYKGMYNPYVKDAVERAGEEFVPIDLSFGNAPVVIIGANMGGKTVVLKTAALCQWLFSFGMGIPAAEAVIAPRDLVFFISGDAQDMGAGLSSFAAEMKAIDEVVRASDGMHDGRRIAAMIDEPARSTNPIEGTALVEALVDILGQRGVALLLTTHYNIPSSHCTRLRVRGLENGRMNYRLCPAPDGDVPHEALNVAESLNISPEWTGKAKKLLEYE